MTKLRLCGTKEFIKALEKDGFYAKGRSKRGSHVIYVKRRAPGEVPYMVPVELNQKEYGRKLLGMMIKQGGWNRKKYHELLDDC